MADDLIRLRFRHARIAQPGPVRLVLGPDGTGPVIPPVEARVALMLPALGMLLRAVRRSEATITVRLPQLGVRLAAAWDSQTERPTVGQTAGRWQLACPLPVGAAQVHWYARSVPLACGQSWQTAQPLRTGATGMYRMLLARPITLVSRWQDAQRAHTSHLGGWQDRTRQPLPLASAWHDADRAHAGSGDTWQDRDRLRQRRNVLWQDATPLHALASDAVQAATRQHQGRIARHQDARRPPPGLAVIVIPIPPTPDDRCYIPPAGDLVRLVFRDLSRATTKLRFRCRTEAADRHIVPPRRAYLMLNHVTLVRLPDHTPLHCTGLTLALDADSWAWQFNASLGGAQLDAVAPNSDGSPVELLASVNGVLFRLLVERISRDRQFGKSALRISGRSRAALLAEPYAAQYSYSSPTYINAQQAALAAITLPGLPGNWSLDWQLADWLLPAGVWQHQGTPLSAVLRIAQAAGGYVQPHPTDDILRILPRYPVAPWDWTGAAADLQLPAEAVSREAIDWQETPAYNEVYLSGESGGILAHVVRDGTTGGLAAPMITDALITAPEVARQRGSAILGAGGRRSRQTLTLQVLPESGIILPGTTLRFMDGDTQHYGVVRGVNVSAGLPTVRQSIEVEAHA
ncbi:hypothetical protein [Chitiniphilus eburneus]|uniref:Uncharacterized protein n=1 Tax=Chitiniphilus eburneus TaxID=2571148 RepID=A0A4U0PXB6_9NEIS|nr:hypothetical protein [Chitiniphilus eburneus]TJZ73195.1 hypothetical protein FAZ21_11295 [Chitiniphilus eburneus]